MKYEIYDFIENPFGVLIYATDTLRDCKMFCREYLKETDGECKVKIKVNERR